MLLRVSAAFFSHLSLKYLYISFFSFSLCSLPAAVIPSSTLQARGHPFLLPFCLPSACPLLLLLPCVPWLPCRLPSLLLSLCPHRARPEAPRRPAVLSPLSGCPLVVAVTRPSSGAKRSDSGGRYSVYMSPALSPLAYVLPWLPSVRPCVCPAVCRLVAVIGGMPQYPGRRRCGAASVM